MELEGISSVSSDICEIPSNTFNAIEINPQTITTSDNKSTCDECFKEFASANTLWAHKKRYHCGDPPMKCNICSKPFYVLFRLTYHLKDKHGLLGDRLEKCLEEHSSKWNIICYDYECQQRFRRMSNYHTHLSEIHGITIEKESRDFTSLEEFNHWFETIERYNNSHYVQHRGERPDRNSIKSKFLFCHRSGYARVRTVKGERKGRKRNTCKMSGYCSSFMEVNQYPDDNVKVKYWKTHTGHGTSNEEDIMHLPIPQSEKEHIAGLLLRGISKHEIVKSYTEESAPGSRMSYLRSHDIGNIKISFHMETDEGLKMYQEHKLAMDLVAKVVQQGVLVFTVPSSIQMNKQYKVRKESECLNKKCPTRCLLCQACTHSLMCECEMAENITCRHIHAVNMWCKFQRQHRLFYEHEQEETELTTNMVVERLPRNYKEFSATGISMKTQMEGKSSENQEYVNNVDTQLENLLEEAKILLVELIALIEECKDINAVTRFIDLLNKTKTVLTSNISKNGKYTESKRRLLDINTKYSRCSRNLPHNSKQNKVNVTKHHINKNIQPIKIITNPKNVSSPYTQETQLNTIKMASSIFLKSSDYQSKFLDKTQVQQSKIIPVKVSKQKAKKIMTMLEPKDNRTPLQDNNYVKEDSVAPKVNFNNIDHKGQVFNSCITGDSASISQTNIKIESQQLVPSSAQFIEENNQLLNSYISNENLLTNTDTGNIQLSLRDSDNRISLPGTSKEHFRIANMINTKDFLNSPSIQEDNSESVRKLRTFVRSNDGQLKEFFFK